MSVLKRLIGVAAAAAICGASGIAYAELGQPVPWQVGFPESASTGMDGIVTLHNFLLVLITLISIFVLALLVTVMVRFNAASNPIPSRTTHNTLLEVAWTVLPVLILVAIAVPSFRLLFQQTVIPRADLTVKATGKQWFWTYTYPDHGPIEFDSLLLRDGERPADQPRLLAVDNPLVVPVNQVVRVLTTGADVIHAFGVPSLGVMMDSIPGRINETWFRATREGIMYGQCRELCGRDHAFMPIAVRVVSDAEFKSWLGEAKKKWAVNDDRVNPASLAAVRSR